MRCAKTNPKPIGEIKEDAIFYARVLDVMLDYLYRNNRSDQGRAAGFFDELYRFINEANDAGT